MIRKIIFLTAILSLLFPVVPQGVGLGPYQSTHPWLAEGFVLESCENPIYAQLCPVFTDVTPATTHPGFCALKDGKFTHYLSACQACVQAKSTSFYFGECSCAATNCPSGLSCQNGNCVPKPTCETLTCGSD